jgi:hypothetical protein
MIVWRPFKDIARRQFEHSDKPTRQGLPCRELDTGKSAVQNLLRLFLVRLDHGEQSYSPFVVDPKLDAAGRVHDFRLASLYFLFVHRFDRNRAKRLTCLAADTAPNSHQIGSARPGEMMNARCLPFCHFHG